MSSVKGVIVKCPFCGAEHQVRNFNNVMCYCEGYGKLYTTDGFWLGRKGEHYGKSVQLSSEDKKVMFSFLRSL